SMALVPDRVAINGVKTVSSTRQRVRSMRSIPPTSYGSMQGRGGLMFTVRARIITCVRRLLRGLRGNGREFGNVRIGVDLVVLNPAVAEADHAMGGLGHFLTVGDDHQRQVTFAVQLVEQFQNQG